MKKVTAKELLEAFHTTDRKIFDAIISEFWNECSDILVKECMFNFRVDFHHAQDLLNDSFIKLITSGKTSYRGDCPPMSYLRRIKRNTTFDFFKKQKVMLKNNATVQKNDIDVLDDIEKEQSENSGMNNDSDKNVSPTEDFNSLAMKSSYMRNVSQENDDGSDIDKLEARENCIPENQILNQELRECIDKNMHKLFELPEDYREIFGLIADGLKPREIAQIIGRSEGATRQVISEARKKFRSIFQDCSAL